MSKKSVNQINNVALTTASAGAITKFYQNVCQALAKADPEKLNVKAIADSFTAHVDKLALVQNKQRSATAGIQVTDADQRRDAAISFIFGLITHMKGSPVAAEAEAARRLHLVVEAYPNLAYIELSRETIQVDGLLRDLGSEAHAADATTLRLAAYIEALDNAQVDFKAADDARRAEKQARAEVAGGQTVTDLRRTCADEYRQLVQVVNAFAIAMPSPENAQFVSDVNGAIAALEQVIATEQAANTRQGETEPKA